MLVTDKQYNMDDAYVHKLDLMIKRMNGTDDNVLPVDGDEGQGKSEFTVGTCYYVAYKTGRTYNVDNIFFDLDKVIKFASSTKEQIIHFDEAVLGLLTTNWQNKLQQKFIKLVMVARKKKHFIVLCIPKFHRLPQYLIEERAIGLAHVYSRNNLHKGRFCYFTKKMKDKLYEDWRRTKIKNYKKYNVFRGSFVQAMKRVFTEEQIKQYDDKKDAAILSLGEDEKDKKTDRQIKWIEQRNILINFLKKNEGLNARQLGERLNQLGIDIKRTALQEILKKPTAEALPSY